MRDLSFRIVLTSISLTIALSIPGQVRAWVGLELDAKVTGVADPYGATGSEGSGSLSEFSARLMYQESFGSLNTEIHWLGQANYTTGDLNFQTLPSDSAFRSIDMETVHQEGGRTTVYSEIDRLSLTWSSPEFSVTAGRQAVSWGEAFYFNVGDLFGAFQVTDTNRRYTPGIDAVIADVNLGPFSSLSLIGVPVDDEPDSYAAHYIFPFGNGTLSLTGGRVLENNKAGAGYTVDISGTQVYGSHLVTSSSDQRGYSQTVLGAERQLGPHTFLMGELFRNGWGSEDPDDYPALLLSDGYISGSVLTLGRYSMAVELSQQVSPLLTLTPAFFANLSDGSTLLRMDGAFSLSDFTDMTGGFFLGLGDRPDSGIPSSEYGSVPFSVYVEVVHNI